MSKTYNAGYEIIMQETYHVREDGLRSVIALGRMETSRGAKYVTWEGSVIVKRGSEESNYFWGHYFEEDKQAAFADYHKRLYECYK